MGLAAPAGRGRPGRQRLHAGCATSSRRVGWGVRGHVAQWRPQTRGLLGCGGIELRPFPTHTCFRRLGKLGRTRFSQEAHPLNKYCRPRPRKTSCGDVDSITLRGALGKRRMSAARPVGGADHAHELNETGHGPGPTRRAAPHRTAPRPCRAPRPGRATGSAIPDASSSARPPRRS